VIAAKAKEAQNETLLKDIPSLLGSAQLSTETEEITAVIKHLMLRDIRIIRSGRRLISMYGNQVFFAFISASLPLG